ncbi:hypothetical protein ACFE04_003215 [Oxalis oulophora]
MGSCCSKPPSSDYDDLPVMQDKHGDARGGGKGGGGVSSNGDGGRGRDVGKTGGGGGGGGVDYGSIVRVHGNSEDTSMYIQQGRKGVNQDAMTVWENFAGDKDMIFCGVFDGHGPSGHKVANHVRDVLPSKLYSAVKKSQLNSRLPSGDDNTSDSLLSLWESSLNKTFKEMDEQVCLDPNLDCFCSGTTGVTVIKQGDHLIVSNLGDSRAVLCTKDNIDQLVPVQLTVDMKPSVASEAKRIKDSRGRVFALDVEPDIWDVLSNHEVIGIVASAKKKSSAAQLLVQRAVKTWKTKYPGSKIDDCAVICLFLKDKPTLSKSLSDVCVDKKDTPRLSVSRSYRSFVSEEEVPAVANESIVKTIEETTEEEFSTVGGVSTLNSLVDLTIPEEKTDGLRWRKPGN